MAIAALSLAWAGGARGQSEGKVGHEQQQTQADQGRAGSPSERGDKGSRSEKTTKQIRDDLAKLHAANRMEIEAARIAEQNGSASVVKDFARQMEKDHGKNDQQVMNLAREVGVDLDASKAGQKEAKQGRKDLDKLRGQTGSKFDRTYAHTMVKDHEKDVKDVTKARDKAKDPNLKPLLDETVPVLQHHLALAKDMQRQVKQSERVGRTGR